MSDKSGQDPVPSVAVVIRLQRHTRTYDAGEIIFSKGEEGNTIFTIHEGVVEIVEAHPRDAEKIVPLALIRKGGFFGAGAAFEHEPHDETAIAQTRCTVLELTADEFLDLFARNKEQSRKRIILESVKRLRQANERYLKALGENHDLVREMDEMRKELRDADWREKKSDQEATAAKSALLAVQLEITALRAAVNQLGHRESEEITSLKENLVVLEKKYFDAAARIKELERELSALTDAYDLLQSRKSTEVASADTASALAFDEIEALKNELKRFQTLVEIARRNPIKGSLSRSIVPKELLAALDALVAEEKK